MDEKNNLDTARQFVVAGIEEAQAALRALDLNTDIEKALRKAAESIRVAAGVIGQAVKLREAE